MRIIKVTTDRLRNEEWFRFHTEYSGLVDAYGPELLMIQRIYSVYKTLYQEADRLLERLQASFITTHTAQAEHLRDELFRGLRDAVKSNLRSLDATKKAAAVKINALILKYNKVIRRDGRAARTAAFDNLLQDLKQGEGGVDLSSEVQILNIDEWVVNLDNANQTFKQSLADRAGEAAHRPQKGRLIQIRTQMNRFYVGMINSIETLLMAIEETNPAPLPDSPDDKLIRFVKELNTYLTHYKSLLKGRHTRKNAIE
ncbi:MAG: DUF6261 family protein [Tannerellaceae bacterium]|nr:DUF6261 family protein [Tannerellaceae bacterium]